MPKRGTKFGNFELMNRLALGGMAEIFLAKERGIEGIQRQVVVKRILPEMTEIDDFVTMFADEARLATRLTHPNIAHVYSFGEIGGIYYLSMEYVEGLTISQLIRRLKGQQLSLEITLRIIGDICAGLHYAHEQRDDTGELLGVVHRDISPQNVMITTSGVAKLIDFGVARASTQVHVTGVSQIKGKLAYMAPEVLRPAKDRFIDRRVDIFAVGVMLHEMVAGERLFRRDSEAATIMAVRESEIPSVIDCGAPAVLDVIIGKAVARDRDERYATAQEMQDDIEELIAESPKAATAYVIGKFMRQVLGGNPESADQSFSFSNSSASKLLAREEKEAGESETTLTSDAPPAFSLPKLPGLAESLEVDISDFRKESKGIEGAASAAPRRTIPLAFEDAPVGASNTADVSNNSTSPPPLPNLPDFLPSREDETAALPSATPSPASNVAVSGPLSKPRVAVLWWALGAVVLLMALGLGGLLALYESGDAANQDGPVLARPGEAAAGMVPIPVVTPAAPDAAPALPAAPDAGVLAAQLRDGGTKGPSSLVAAAVAPPADSRPVVDSGPTKGPVVRVQKLAPGTLYLDTEPWSKVRAGRRGLGTTPLIGVKLAAGIHILRLTDSDGETARRRVLIKSGQPTKVFFRLH